MTVTVTDRGKLELSLISSVMAVLSFKIQLNIWLWMKLLCPSKGELFSNTVFQRYFKHFGKKKKNYKLFDTTNYA
jgi:hypothetical protein